GERFDLRLMSWGDGSGVPTSGQSLVIVGTDNNGLLHIRIFDLSGKLVTDTDETQLPSAQASAISNLKQQLPGLLPPLVLTGADKAQVITEATSIVGQTLGEHGDSVRSVAFSPDSRTALTGSSDTTARLWDLATRRELHRLQGHTGAVHGV